mmetsp:Transcript_2431/g.3440  ORF Transcript_2431/g.3440 Transcript_2431/m.3440 type:complete len:100 (+) Transcript_2431:774-1073(+)
MMAAKKTDCKTKHIMDEKAAAKVSLSNLSPLFNIRRAIEAMVKTPTVFVPVRSSGGSSASFFSRGDLGDAMIDELGERLSLLMIIYYYLFLFLLNYRCR